jgi:hypothetical protein
MAMKRSSRPNFLTMYPRVKHLLLVSKATHTHSEDGCVPKSHKRHSNAIHGHADSPYDRSLVTPVGDVHDMSHCEIGTWLSYTRSEGLT